MKRLISLILAIALLCTPACALSWEDLPELPKNIFDSQELKDATRGLIDDMNAAKDTIKAMSDEELETYIRQKAAELPIPEMNEEQIAFLMDIARSLETAEQIGDTIREYQNKAEGIGDTLSKLMDTLNNILDTLTGLLDSLQGIVDLFGGSEETPAAT